MQPYFWENKQYEESLTVALQCRKYWADYDLELMIGENYQELDKYELAERYYDNASMMCPSRFLPLYKLFIYIKIWVIGNVCWELPSQL